VEIDGIHEAPVTLDEIDASLAQASGRLQEGRP
jgi:hypothetical protein